MRLAAHGRKPRLLEIELTHRCAGGCNYCFASGRPQDRDYLDLNVVRRVLDEATEIGMRMVWWLGGEPLFHPHLFDLVHHAARLRMAQVVVTSGLIGKGVAAQLAEVKDYIHIVVHLDTVDPEAYAKVNRNPGTLSGKMRGYENLLAAGFPEDQVTGQVTIVRPVVESFGRTLDWFKDRMGANFVLTRVFKPLGMGKEAVHLEPSLENVRSCFIRRNAKFGTELPFKTLDVNFYICRSNVGIHPDGEVTPCLFLRDQGLGNVYHESFRKIVAEHRDELFFNFVPEGPCGMCECHNDPDTCCIGCRVNALVYTGNLRGSDPKCSLNPEAPMYCLY
jgi:MoaA/NifB/PqqE/SkfB family radical SAM enzyme